jgi:hypothetical protein
MMTTTRVRALARVRTVLGVYMGPGSALVGAAGGRPSSSSSSSSAAMRRAAAFAKATSGHGTADPDAVRPASVHMDVTEMRTRRAQRRGRPPTASSASVVTQAASTLKSAAGTVWEKVKEGAAAVAHKVEDAVVPTSATRAGPTTAEPRYPGTDALAATAQRGTVAQQLRATGQTRRQAKAAAPTPPVAERVDAPPQTLEQATPTYSALHPLPEDAPHAAEGRQRAATEPAEAAVARDAGVRGRLHGTYDALRLSAKLAAADRDGMVAHARTLNHSMPEPPQRASVDDVYERARADHERAWAALATARPKASRM